MEYFRITKYNPLLRDKNDIYRNKDNWTEYFMVKNNTELLEDYNIIEQNYVDLLLEVLDIIKVDNIYSKWLSVSEEQVKNSSKLLYLDKFIKKCFNDSNDNLEWIDFNSFMKNYKWIKINSLLYSRFDGETYWIYHLRDQIKFSKNFFESIFKLSLRWFAWIFYFFWKHIKIRFSYNFYMFLSVKDWVITNDIINKYHKKWLFIEKREDFKSFFSKINYN